MTALAERIHTQPRDGDHASETIGAFSADVDLTETPVGLTLTTGDFPHE
ncbi:hypothetical protein [Streptomyces xantholiticus]|nr:hypothetical protein [Streptomyces xantholiticus]GGW59442.1 hypothetical protein GCM10010381_50880 [Streptomyces xantholiticus]